MDSQELGYGSGIPSSDTRLFDGYLVPRYFYLVLKVLAACICDS